MQLIRDRYRQLFPKTEPEPQSLLEVTPPRLGERTLLGVENMIQSIADEAPFSLEVSADSEGATLMVRTSSIETVRGQIAAHYPQAVVRNVAPEDDPLQERVGESPWTASIRSVGPEHAPLRTFRDDDLLDPGSDPFIAVLGAVSALSRGERLVVQLLMRPLGPDWSRSHIARFGESRAVPPSRINETSATGATHLTILGIATLIALRGYAWIQSGEMLKAAILGIASVVGLGAAGWAWNRRIVRQTKSIDPAAVREKLSRGAFEAEVRVTVFLPSSVRGDAEIRAEELVERVATAYRRCDNPAGARLAASGVVAGSPDPNDVSPNSVGIFKPRSVIGVREAAVLWHPPGSEDDTPLLERSGSKALTPSARKVQRGALVGETIANRTAQVRLPDDLLRRHHLYVARTRMGKSTLMRHIVAYKMSEKADGRDRDVVIVVDPHADLVDGLLELVPRSLAQDVRLIDLADDRGAPGINLIDTRVFADRDRTADSVVRVAKGLWDQWGPRMQSILEHVVKTLHEANMHSETEEHAQMTLLDGLRLLSDESFRAAVLSKVSDPFLMEWWARDFGSWHRIYRAEALAPVQTRLSYYASSVKARAVLGQPRCTVDLRSIVRNGGVLLISTAQSAVGRDVSALVGASILNLLDSVLREQGSLAPADRRGALVVVDEMQTIPGVDFEAMLSELGKFGASFILATQSLARLGDLSPTMKDSLMANIGCLCVFQVSGSDARSLVWELGRDRVAEDDIVSLPAHCCYVRATVGTERMPTFSMKVLPPATGDRATATAIRLAASAYITPTDEIEAGHAESRSRLANYREGLADLAAKEETRSESNTRTGRGRRRSRRRNKNKETTE